MCIYKITCCQAKWLSLSLFLFFFLSRSLSLSLSIHAYPVEKDWGAEGLFMQFSQHTPTLPRDRDIPPDSIICAPPERAQMHAKLACRNPRQPADGVHKCMQTWRAEVHASVAPAYRNAHQKIVHPQKSVCKNALRLACRNARLIKICLYTPAHSSHLACKSARQGRSTSDFFKA